jgi:hypothetical protein
MRDIDVRMRVVVLGGQNLPVFPDTEAQCQEENQPSR